LTLRTARNGIEGNENLWQDLFFISPGLGWGVFSLGGQSARNVTEGHAHA